jgi:superkiller protein 3
VPAILDIGVTLLEHGEWKKAIEYFQRAIRLEPNNADAYYNLGNAFADAKRNEDAAAAYRKALELSPAFAEAHDNLGTLLFTLGQLNEAAQHFQEAIRLQPEHLATYDNLGMTLAQQGRFDEAIQVYRKALELAIQQNNTAVAAALQKRLALCEAKKPFRSSPPASGVAPQTPVK